MRTRPRKWLCAPIAIRMQTRDSHRAFEALALRKSPKFEGH